MGEVMASSSGGIEFSGLLTIVFVVLKLTGYIAWSWWWVLSPLWIPAAIFGGVLFCIGIFMVLCVIVAAIATLLPWK
jgi:hypothetical protein